MELSFEERRVVGTLIEKGYTADQYPLTMNGLVLGSNQKSCRHPMTNFDEEKVLRALDGLRMKGLVTLIQLANSRVERWKHRFGEALSIEDKETAVIGELLLRGPQTDGELRARASRMARIENVQELEAILAKLSSRDPPLVVRLSPEGRKRGVRWTHNLYPAGEIEELRRQEAEAPEPAGPGEAQRETQGEGAASGGGGMTLRQEIDALQLEMAILSERVKKIEESLGGPA
jgi:uncharacterized protein YceH (UPF0502 family)